MPTTTARPDSASASAVQSVDLPAPGAPTIPSSVRGRSDASAAARATSSATVMVDTVGVELAEELRDKSLDLYRRAAEYALAGENRGRPPGLILADTKFEWGIEESTGELLLIDEALTPDSSRYWDAAQYRPGHSPASFDKQFVRDWLERSRWDKASPPPPIGVISASSPSACCSSSSAAVPWPAITRVSA